MKRLNKILFMLTIIITLVMYIKTNKVKAFGQNEHISLVVASSAILEKEKNDVFKFFVENYCNDGNFIKIIQEFSSKPDNKDSDGEKINGTHYYVYEGAPSTYGQYYLNNDILGEEYGISARTRFEDHYSNAINCYINNNTNMAMQSLGRAIHYLQDIGCTPHSSGLTSTSSSSDHAKYENYLYDYKVSILEEIGITVKIETINNAVQVTKATAKDDRSVYGQYYFDNNIGLICNELASLTSVYEDVVQDESYHTAATNNIKLTVSYIAGLLNRFYEDVNFKSSCHDIRSGSTYLIKNVETGEYFDTRSNSDRIIMNEFDGSLYQQFKIEPDNLSGAFQICPVAYPNEKLAVNINTYGYAYLKHGSYNTETFKITNVGNGHYRIASKTNRKSMNFDRTTNPEYQYTFYLNVHDGYYSPNPTDPNILWDFIEVVEDLNYSAFNLSKTENKVFYYTPTTSGNQSFTTISKYSTNISINDITTRYESTRSQSYNDYYFTSGHKYLISVSFQSQNVVGDVIFCKNYLINDYENLLMLDKLNNGNSITDKITLLMGAGDHSIVIYTPSISEDYRIENRSSNNTNVQMKIYDMSSNNFKMIYNSTNISEDNRNHTVKQLQSGHTYYIDLYVEDDIYADKVYFSITRPEFQVTESENIITLNEEMKYFKFVPTATEIYSIYTSQNVDLQVYDSFGNPIFNNYGNNILNIICHFDKGKTYFISVSSYEYVEFGLFISKSEAITNTVPKDMSLMPAKTEVFKIDFSNTELMSFYTTNKNTLKLFEYFESFLFYICDNQSNLNIPLKQLIDSNKIYYLFVTSYVDQSDVLIISKNIDSILNSAQTIIEKNSNNEGIIYHESISTNGEVKYYKFTPLVNGVYTFNTIASNNGNTFMELYDQNGNIIAYDDDSGDTWSSKINYSLTKGVNYYISVRYKFYNYTGQYDLQVYSSADYVWKVNWFQIEKRYAEMGYFTIINDFYIWSLGVLDSVDSINKILTFSSITWSWSVENPYNQYQYQSIGMIIGKRYLGEVIDPITGNSSYNYFLVEGNGVLDVRAVTPNTWHYDCTYYDVSFEFSNEEWEYYCNAGIIKFEPR